MQIIYEELETFSLEGKSLFELKDYLNKIKFNYTDKNELQKIQWEIDTFAYNGYGKYKNSGDQYPEGNP